MMRVWATNRWSIPTTIGNQKERERERWFHITHMPVVNDKEMVLGRHLKLLPRSFLPLALNHLNLSRDNDMPKPIDLPISELLRTHKTQRANGCITVPFGNWWIPAGLEIHHLWTNGSFFNRVVHLCSHPSARTHDHISSLSSCWGRAAATAVASSQQHAGPARQAQRVAGLPMVFHKSAISSLFSMHLGGS